MFADDTYLFIRASVPECAHLLHVFEEYGLTSGQQVNLQKSTICTSANVEDHEKESLANYLGVKEVGLQDKYLGLPVQVQRSKTRTFRFLEDGLAARIRSWKSKSMSLAAKETVIKSVGSASTIYAMSAFRIPATSCRRMNSQLSRFWWANQDKEKGIHWLSWPEVCHSKFEGGLGFRDFDRFNIALLAKQAWRLLQMPDSPIAVLYKARYHPSTSILTSEVGSRASWAWQGILEGRDLLARGLRWRIGNGAVVRILTDKWLPSSPPSSPSLLPTASMSYTFVSELICPQSHSWKVAVLQDLFTVESVELILSIPLPNQLIPDKLVWHYSVSGEYTVKTGYQLLSSELNRTHPPRDLPYDKRFWKFLWQLPVPPKLRVFCWRVARGFLPVRAVLHYKRLVDDNVCPICSNGIESILHSFLHCRVAVELWELAGFGLRRARLSSLSHADCWKTLFFECRLSKTDVANVVFLCWRVWKSRFWAIHKFIQYRGPTLLRQFQAQVEEWRAATSPLTLHQGPRGQGRQVPASRSGRDGLCPDRGVLVRFDGAWRQGSGGGIGLCWFLS
ncbi:unnamed protein product [Linum trigynum]|uniref:Reverse transcriptase zinc-binding domain-containing protein n=1 Tax=Linum trigynum TaxID=586398 RepID=A0AAV2C612_9ROSI